MNKHHLHVVKICYWIFNLFYMANYLSEYIYSLVDAFLKQHLKNMDLFKEQPPSIYNGCASG